MVIWSKPQVQPPDLTRFSHIEIKYAWSWSFRKFLTSKVCWHFCWQFIEFRVGFLGSRSNVIFLQDSRRVLKYQKIYQKYLTSENCTSENKKLGITVTGFIFSVFQKIKSKCLFKSDSLIPARVSDLKILKFSKRFLYVDVKEKIWDFGTPRRKKKLEFWKHFRTFW